MNRNEVRPIPKCPACGAELVALDHERYASLMAEVRASIGDPSLEGYACSKAHCRVFVAVGDETAQPPTDPPLPEEER